MRCHCPAGSGKAYLPDWFRKLPAIDEARLSTPTPIDGEALPAVP